MIDEPGRPRVEFSSTISSFHSNLIVTKNSQSLIIIRTSGID